MTLYSVHGKWNAHCGSKYKTAEITTACPVTSAVQYCLTCDTARSLSWHLYWMKTKCTNLLHSMALQSSNRRRETSQLSPHGHYWVLKMARYRHRRRQTATSLRSGVVGGRQKNGVRRVIPTERHPAIQNISSIHRSQSTVWPRFAYNDKHDQLPTVTTPKTTQPGNRRRQLSTSLHYGRQKARFNDICEWLHYHYIVICAQNRKIMRFNTKYANSTQFYLRVIVYHVVQGKVVTQNLIN